MFAPANDIIDAQLREIGETKELIAEIEAYDDTARELALGR